MSYAEKIAKVKAIIDSHNQIKKTVDFDKFVTNLQEAGGTTDEALRVCTWEDLERFGLPSLLAKQAASVFRAKEEPASRRLITEARSQMMTPRELLDAYDPRNHDNFVGKRLSELARGKPCLVYNEDGTVNAEVSAKLLDELRDNYPTRESVMVGDRPFKVYNVGQRPDQFAFENPLFPGTLLRPDDTCDHTNRSWAKVPEVVRVLLYLAVKETKEIKIMTVDNAHSALDMASTEVAEKQIRNRYPKASLLYDDMKARGCLPTLRLSRSPRPSNDPFFQTHKRY